MDELRDSPYPLRMKPELREKLEAMAKKHHRPLSQEIISILTNAIEGDSGLAEVKAELKKIQESQDKILSKLS